MWEDDGSINEKKKNTTPLVPPSNAILISWLCFIVSMPCRMSFVDITHRESMGDVDTAQRREIFPLQCFICLTISVPHLPKGRKERQK